MIQVFKEGDDVLSKWTDGNMYPGTVIQVKDSGSCLVMFFDGLKKVIPPSNMKILPPSEKVRVFSSFL